MHERLKVAICSNTAWYVYNFRASTIEALLDSGHDVIVCCPHDDYVTRIRSLGADWNHVRMSRSGLNVVEECTTVLDFVRVFRRTGVDIVLNFTPKCNVYGSLAAVFLRVPYVNNISGVGFLFSKPTLAARILKLMYRLTQPRASRVFFQNEDDRRTFIEAKMVTASQSERILGSGVSLSRFQHEPRKWDGCLRCVFVGRLLREKGVGVFMEVASILGNQAEFAFAILGGLDPDNPSAILQTDLDESIATGTITYLGFTDRVEDYLPHYDVVVLPTSYGEGMPKSLMEAAAMGKIVVTSDAPGCRDTVSSESGILLSEPNPAVLREALERLAAISPEDREGMGRAARRLAEAQFSDTGNIAKYLAAVRDALPDGAAIGG